MSKSFSDILKDITATSVHTPTVPGNKAPKARAVDFNASLAASAILTKRQLHTNTDGTTAKSPFLYDPNALGSLRPDQVPRFFGALTDGSALPVQSVQLSDLHAMQDRVDPAKVSAIQSAGGAGDKKAVVVQHAGKQYIADGHHRLTADWMAGKTDAEVHFKDLEPVDNALKRAPAELDLHVAKVDSVSELGVVFGWAIVCKVNGVDYYDLNWDHSGPHAGKAVPENITENAMLKCAVEFGESERPGNEMHGGPDVGKFVNIFPLTTEIAKAMGIQTQKTGLMVGYKPSAEALAKFKDGTYSGFSIEGRRVTFEEG